MSCDQYDDASSPGDALADVVARMVKRLRPHCDAVQIIAMKHDDAADQTYTVTDGAGNYQARYGAMKRWVIRADEDTRADARDARDCDEADDD